MPMPPRRGGGGTSSGARPVRSQNPIRSELDSRITGEFSDQSSAGCFRCWFDAPLGKQGLLHTTRFEPPGILRHSNQESLGKEKEIDGSGWNFGSWLPVVDAFRTFAVCPSAAVRVAFQQIPRLTA